MNNVGNRIRVTHPYHPLFNQEFQFIGYRKSWGTQYVDYCDVETATAAFIPRAWTSLAEFDLFVSTSNGRSKFRFDDLLRLCDLVSDLSVNNNQQIVVKQNTPFV